MEEGSQLPRPGGCLGLEFHSGKGSACLEDLEQERFDLLGDLGQQLAKRSTDMGVEWNAVDLGQAVVDPDEADVAIEEGETDRGVGQHRLQLGGPSGDPLFKTRVERPDLFLGQLPLADIEHDAVENQLLFLDVRAGQALNPLDLPIEPEDASLEPPVAPCRDRLHDRTQESIAVIRMNS